jgi:hypothetical protein
MGLFSKADDAISVLRGGEAKVVREGVLKGSSCPTYFGDMCVDLARGELHVDFD